MVDLGDLQLSTRWRPNSECKYFVFEWRVFDANFSEGGSVSLNRLRDATFARV